VKSPTAPLYIFWEKDRGLRRGAKIGNGSPLMVKNRAAHQTVKNHENYSATHKTVRTAEEQHIH
jgi:hypothetical protein